MTMLFTPQASHLAGTVSGFETLPFVTWRRTLRRVAAGLAVAAMTLAATSASAFVRFDNYRGNQAVPVTPATPNYTNYVSSDINQELPNLISFANGGAGNIASSGTGTAIAWPANSFQLCDNRTVANGGNPSGAACQAALQGRVTYALVKFPKAGTYTFGVAHDDQVQLEFSTAYDKANAANYRNFYYNVPVGAVGSWSDDESDFQTIPGNFRVAQDGACYAMRLYWNNRTNLNYLHLRWTKPAGSTTPLTEVIPAANLLDPGDPNSYDQCANIDTDLAIYKAVSSPTFAGSSGANNNTFSYTVTVWNKGPNATSNVVFADTLPAGLVASNGNGTPSWSCTAYSANGSAMNSGTANITVTNNGNAYAVTMGGSLPVYTGSAVTVPPTTNARLVCTTAVRYPNGTVPNSLTNTATLTVKDSDPSNNSSSVTINRTDVVSVVKTGPATATQGVAFNYQLTVTNNSGSGKSNIVVKDLVPPNVTINSASINPGNVSCPGLPQTGGTLTCTITSSTPSGQNRVITLSATASGAGSITNYVATNPSGSGNPTSNPGPSCDTSTTSCDRWQTTVSAPPNMALAKVFNPQTITAGQTSLLTLTLSNTAAGSVALSNLSVTDTFPAGLVVAANPSAGGTCTGNRTAVAGSNSVSLASGTLAAGASCTVTVNVTSSTAGSYPNTVPVGAVSSAQGATNSTSATDTLTVNLPIYTVTATANPGGSIADGNCNPSSVTSGGSSTCTADPAPGYAFAGWTGACAGKPEICQLTNITGNLSSVASFTPLPGTLTVTKMLSGTTFTSQTSYPFTVTCANPAATYNGTATVAANAGSGSTTVSIPAGSTNCQITETVASRPAPPTNYSWSSPTYSQPTQTAMAPAGSASGGITNPLTRNQITVTINKTVTGLPSGTGAPGNYGFKLTCDGTDYTGTAVISGTTSTTGSGTVQVPQGVTCTALAETSKATAPTNYTWSTETTVPPAGTIATGASGSITNPVTRNQITVTINKTVTGLPSGTGAPGNYGFKLTCDGTDYTGTAVISGAASTTGSGTVQVPQGATCTALAETSKATAPTNYTWSTETATPPTGAITTGAAGNITNPLSANDGTLTVTKTLTGTSFTSQTSYPFTVTCANPTATYDGTAAVAANASSGSTTVSIPAGSTACQIAETTASRPAAPTNYGWGNPTYTQPSQTAMAPGGTASGDITNPLVTSNLTVAKTAATSPTTNPPAVAQGGVFTYGIAVTNSGPLASGADTTVVDQVPAGVSITNVTPGSGWVCKDSANNTLSGSISPARAGAFDITCTLAAGVPAANGGQNTTVNVVTLTAVKTADRTQNVTNTAQVKTGDPVCESTPSTGRCSSSVTVNDASKPFLGVGKAASPTSVAKDGSVTYAITVSNSGPAASGTPTTITDNVPSGLTITSVTLGTNWTCADGASNPLSGTVNLVGPAAIACTNANGVPAGSYDSATNTFTPATETVVTLVATKTGVTDVTNTATVTAGDQRCTGGAAQGCTASATVTDNSKPSLVMSKTADKSSAAQGASVAFTLSVSNTGPVASASGPVVVDTVPAGLKVTGVANGAGWSCSPTSTSGSAAASITCTKTGGTVAADTVHELVATVTATKTSNATVTNTVRVTSGDPVCAGEGAPDRCSASVDVRPSSVGPLTPVPVGPWWPIALLLSGVGGLALRRRMA